MLRRSLIYAHKLKKYKAPKIRAMKTYVCSGIFLSFVVLACIVVLDYPITSLNPARLLLQSTYLFAFCRIHRNKRK